MFVVFRDINLSVLDIICSIFSSVFYDVDLDFIFVFIFF